MPESRKLSLSQIRLDPTLDRSHFDPIKMQELQDSLSERGLLNRI